MLARNSKTKQPSLMLRMEAENSKLSRSVGQTAYLQVKFYSAIEKWAKVLPKSAFDVPDAADRTQLNCILTRIITDTDDPLNSTEFDFLINGILLRSHLREAVEEQEISTESVIKLECINVEAAPSPHLDLTHDDWVAALRSSDHCIISGCYDNCVYLWSLNGKLIRKAMGHSGSVKCLQLISVSDTGIRFVTGSQDQTLIIWSSNLEEEAGKGFLKEQAVCRGHERSVECVSSNGNGSRLISGSFDSYLKVWNISAIADDLSGNDNMVAKKRKKEIETVDIQTPMVTLAGHKDAIVGSCWSPLCDKEVMTASWDHSIIIWDLEQAGQKSYLASTKPFTSISMSSQSGYLVTGSADQNARLWDPRSKEGSFVKQTFTSHFGWISCVCWSPNNANLFISGSYDKVLKLWDIRSPKAPLYDMKGHEDRILACDWSSADRIISGGADRSMKSFRRNN